jgi:hypothetical protein
MTAALVVLPIIANSSRRLMELERMSPISDSSRLTDASKSWDTSNLIKTDARFWLTSTTH